MDLTTKIYILISFWSLGHTESRSHFFSHTIFFISLPWQRIWYVKLVKMTKNLKFNKNERHKSTYTRNKKINICIININSYIKFDIVFVENYLYQIYLKYSLYISTVYVPKSWKKSHNLAQLPIFATITLKIQHINDNQVQMYMK